MAEEERWKRIEGSKHHWISSLGRVYREGYFLTYLWGKNHNVCRQRWVEGGFVRSNLSGGRRENKHKYLYVNIDGHSQRVHRLVAEAFVDGRDDEHCEVNHIDHNPLNNAATNLEWCSHLYNMQHRRISEISKNATE